MTHISLDQPGPSNPTAAEDAQRPSHAPRRAVTWPAESPAFEGLARRPLPHAPIEDAVRRRHARIRQVPEEELPLAGYLTVRGLVGRLVEEKNVARLRLGDEAVRRTRQTLPHGRGNVDDDVLASDRESEMRAVAAWVLLQEHLYDGTGIVHDVNANFYALCAMAGKVFGAGSCDQYAPIAAFSYGTVAKDAGRPPDEQVQVVADDRHVWAEVTTPVHDSNVVMDAWADGPAVLAEDGRFASDRESARSYASFHLAHAAELDDWMDRVSKLYLAEEADIDTRLDAALEKMRNAPGDSFQVWRPQAVLSDDFIARMQQRLDENIPWKAVCAEVQATGVARSLGVDRVPNVLADVPKIVKAAQTLAQAGRQTGEASSPGTA